MTMLASTVPVTVNSVSLLDALPVHVNFLDAPEAAFAALAGDVLTLLAFFVFTLAEEVGMDTTGNVAAAMAEIQSFRMFMARLLKTEGKNLRPP